MARKNPPPSKPDIEGPTDSRWPLPLAVQEHKTFGPTKDTEGDVMGAWHKREGVLWPRGYGESEGDSPSRSGWPLQKKEDAARQEADRIAKLQEEYDLRGEWVASRLERLGYREGPFLGQGSFGWVVELYTLDGQATGLVAKVTSDANEVATVYRLLQAGTRSTALPVVLGAWGGLPGGYWLIIREGLADCSELGSSTVMIGKRFPHSALCSAVGLMDWYGDKAQDLPSNPLRRARLQRYYADHLLNLKIALAALSDAEKGMIKRFQRELRRIWKQSGVRFHDLNSSNIRVRPGSNHLVVSDFGVSTGPGTTVPIAANPRKVEPRLYEARDDHHVLQLERHHGWWEARLYAVPDNPIEAVAGIPGQLLYHHTNRNPDAALSIPYQRVLRTGHPAGVPAGWTLVTLPFVGHLIREIQRQLVGAKPRAH